MMSDPPLAGRRPVTDSPWFWACVFCTFALIALVMMEPRYGRRQARIEREYQARQMSGRAVGTDSGPVQLSSADNTIITLGPLYAVLSVVLLCAWGGFVFQRLRSEEQGARSKRRDT